MSHSSPYAECIALQQTACAALGDPEKLEVLRVSLERLSSTLQEYPLQPNAAEGRLGRAVLYNVRTALQIMQSLRGSQEEAICGLASDLDEIRRSSTFHRSISPPLPSPTSTPTSISDPTPTSHLRHWFLSNLINPFPSNKDKLSLRLLVPDMPIARINGWMANMRRRSGWTLGVEKFGEGSKLRWQEMIRRVEEGRVREGEGEEGEEEWQEVKALVKEIKNYVVAKKKRTTRVGEWLENIMVPDAPPSTSDTEEDYSKRRRIDSPPNNNDDTYMESEPPSSAGPSTSTHHHREQRQQSYSHHHDQPNQYQQSQRGSEQERHSQPPPPRPSLRQFNPSQSILESRHLPIPPAMISPRTVSTSSTSTSIATNITTLSNAMVVDSNMIVQPQVQQLQPQPLVYYQPQYVQQQLVMVPVAFINPSPVPNTNESRGVKRRWEEDEMDMGTGIGDERGYEIGERGLRGGYDEDEDMEGRWRLFRG